MFSCRFHGRFIVTQNDTVFHISHYFWSGTRSIVLLFRPARNSRRFSRQCETVFISRKPGFYDETPIGQQSHCIALSMRIYIHEVFLTPHAMSMFPPCLTLPAIFWPLPYSWGKWEHFSTSSAFSRDYLFRSLRPAFQAVAVRPVLNIFRKRKDLPAVPASSCDHPMPRHRNKQSLNPLEQYGHLLF